MDTRYMKYTLTEAAAQREKTDDGIDVYPQYSSDVLVTMAAGNNLRHGLTGSGIYATHGDERDHKDGVRHPLIVSVGSIRSEQTI